MSTFYITSNTYTVCTFQMSSEPQKILDDRLDPNVVLCLQMQIEK